MAPRKGNSAPFTDNYREDCFQKWFLSGQPTRPSDIVKLLVPDEHGRIPSKPIIISWRQEMGWDLRADELNARVSLVSDEQLIAMKVLMLKEHAEKGKELSDMGMNFLRQSISKFDTSSAAVSAIIKGAELERNSLGLSEALLKISKMTEEELKKSIISKLNRAGDMAVNTLNAPEEVDVVDAEVKEEDTET